MTLLIRNATLVLPDRVLPRGYVRIEGNRITEVGEGEPPPNSLASLLATDAHIPDATHKVVLPGLVNAHTHLEQTFMRGYSANRALLDWLRNYIWKLQAAMDVEDVRLAVTLGIVEAMRGGATTIVDHHKVPFSRAHTDVVLEAAQEAGARPGPALGRRARAPGRTHTRAVQPMARGQRDVRVSLAWRLKSRATCGEASSRLGAQPAQQTLRRLPAAQAAGRPGENVNSSTTEARSCLPME